MAELNITLNGNAVKGFNGETILELARRNGIKIPTLCNDGRLEPFSSCFVCVVEIAGMRGLQPSCSTKITEGMVIKTDSEKVYKSRKTALELLLSNHYADCIGPCKQTCPAGVDVQGYISMIEKGMYSEAIEIIKETNPLPAICGRVCVRPCEVACRRNLMDEGAPVGVDYLKRFVADYDLNSANKYIPKVKPSTNKKVAVIGAGPGGLASAFFLQKEGHQVDIFEASPHGGGMLRYGIPEYRLPNNILDAEIDNIKEIGVNVFYNKKLGESIKYIEIKKKYDATILAIGSQAGTSVGCEGDDARNVLSGIDFLRTMEMTGKRYDFKGKKVAIIGGGNTAMDCCRSALRCGAEKVYIIYRRTEKEMPANPIEIHESKLEGVEYLFLTAPSKINKDAHGILKSMTCIKMTLGEPDASGRRRPVAEVGSDFDVELDYVIAAIGQKTVFDFAEDINSVEKEGELKANKWGDLDVIHETLQTGVKSIFAAGDGVTGPATLIEAVAQGRLAAHSCNQYLSGMPIIPPQKEFLSKKDNFKKQIASDYINKFEIQARIEMPTLSKEQRMNFNEVELGYVNEEVAREETCRCLECGCVEYHTCDLKRIATEYGAEQKTFSGEFKQAEVDFSHPFIEIDNNKCVLCSRCIRICSDVVGANALGLVDRGFNTYVAPSMGDSLNDTDCESCGLCISACPTAAINENFKFKPGPVKTAEISTICNFCSIGCEITLNHKNGFVMKVTGKEGMVNIDGNLCKYPKFGYNYINSSSRITKPLYKINGKFEEISFEKAYEIIGTKVKASKADENAFFAGARLTNEEIYLIKKFAKEAVNTDNISSFHYIGRGDYSKNSFKNAEFSELYAASKVYLLGSEINKDNAVLGFEINNARVTNGVQVELITNKADSAMKKKVDAITKVDSYYYFVKAVNHFLLSKGLQNSLFIGKTKKFEEYKATLLKENFADLCKKSGVSACIIEKFAENYYNFMNAIIVFSEKELSANTCAELHNLAMITGKLGKIANGLISLKEKNNSQGLIDLGITDNHKVFDLLKGNKFKNIFIFDEDPIGTSTENNRSEVIAWFKDSFVVVQDYFKTETAEVADLILPASMPFEIGGTFTNTQKMIQSFENSSSKLKQTSLLQLSNIISLIGVKVKNSIEVADLLKDAIKDENFEFIPTSKDKSNRLFNHGCDVVVKMADKGFLF
ncbi:MAG: FAD-dependent oxidoreductase [Bacteroidota bacterium]